REKLEEEGASRISIFGSYARGDETGESDVDVLVRFEERKSLLDIVRIERELSEEIGKDVDLVTQQSMSPYIQEKVAGEQEVILA
ncbi:MAG: nucleotidyltransferase family protein, partial [Candidatus Nanohaloarchaea archaeon]|nr:nucleotidyltransferase family protein [Candidatus Nanohaloarchaea archaeon]